MKLVLYNSLSRKKEAFEPLKEDELTIYVCGPTVYAPSHIGHARSAVAFDAIYRYLLYLGFNVKYARNYTDVDDKIIKKANEEGIDSLLVAERNIKGFDEDMAALGVRLPNFRPKATETMPEIIALIERLIEKGFAYALEGDVYFSVRKFDGYGKLSGKNIEELESGARVAVDERKEDPLDFALWKAAKPGEPSWPAPFGGSGQGRPGWHIECSAMSQSILGDTIDIHGGGKDLIFPHHENEIAQSEAATGKPFVRYWLHNGFVNIDKEKMSKSIGNILSIGDALAEHSGEVIRLFLLSSHYRSPIDYTEDSLTEAGAALERFYRTLKRIDEAGVSEEADVKRVEEKMISIEQAMDDDFNTAQAIGTVFEEVNEANRILDSAGAGGEGLSENALAELAALREVFKRTGEILGVFDKSAAEFFDEIKSSATVDPAEIERLIAERNRARADKEFALADKIRDDLKAKGIVLEDTAKGTEWTVG